MDPVSPDLARAAVRIGVFVALTSGILAVTGPRDSAERAISWLMFVLALGFLGGVALRIRRS